MNKIFEQGEGFYSLTDLGFKIFLVIMILLVVVAALSLARKKENKPVFSVNQLAFTGMALALAFALSYIKLWRSPWGGSVTLCSMLIVVLIGYWYGPKIGLTAAFAYSILQFVQGGGGYILSFWQVMFDYFLAFTALGLSGFFRKKKNGLLIGYLVSIAARWILHSIGGYLYWMEYMPDTFPKSLTAVYPLVYNIIYIGLEGVLTVIVLLLPPVKEAIKNVTKEANK
ncbi:MAG: energy-coupled thiamine transporter ThiT [Lachnospiraceae bacterium]|nr:energy-coupled thiamine transporter ThiT [Lachnospiraceae bacterium]